MTGVVWWGQRRQLWAFGICDARWCLAVGDEWAASWAVAGAGWCWQGGVVVGRWWDLLWGQQRWDHGVRRVGGRAVSGWRIVQFHVCVVGRCILSRRGVHVCVEQSLCDVKGGRIHPSIVDTVGGEVPCVEVAEPDTSLGELGVDVDVSLAVFLLVLVEIVLQ